MGKNIWNAAQTVSSLGTGKQYLLLVKVGYYLLLPLAALAFKFIHCLLSFIILYIRYTNVPSYGLGGHSMA